MKTIGILSTEPFYHIAAICSRKIIKASVVKMKYYFVSRWGNPEEGADGHDTNFIVVAHNQTEAGELADVLLKDMPWRNGPNVLDFCSVMSELGTTVEQKPMVVHGPWVASAILRNHVDETLAITWHRFKQDDVWKSWDEVK